MQTDKDLTQYQIHKIVNAAVEKVHKELEELKKD